MPVLLDHLVTHGFTFRLGDANDMETLAGVSGQIDGFQVGSMKLRGDMIAGQVGCISTVFNIGIDIPSRNAFRLGAGGWKGVN